MATNMSEEERRVLSLDKRRSRTNQASRFLGRFKSTTEVDGHCVSFTEPNSYEAGQYLRLRYAIEARRPEQRGMVVGIFSPAAGDGKSLTAVNVAGALAQRRGSRILLVDADLRRGSESIRHLLPVPGPLAPGLSELLLGAKKPEVKDVIRRLEHTNVSVVLTGALSVAPYEALSSALFGVFIQQVANCFDYIVVDAPPVIAVPDCKILAHRMDGIITVVEADSTPRMLVAQALDMLGPEKVMGILFNRSDQLPPRYHRYYGNYGYSESANLKDIGQIAAMSGNS